jgi:hypothetical protein
MCVVPQCNYELKNASRMQESTQDGTPVCSVGNWDNYHHRRVQARVCTYLHLLLPLYGKWIVDLLDAIGESLLLRVDELGVIEASNVSIKALVSVGKVAGPQLGKLEGHVWRRGRFASRLCAHADRSLIQQFTNLLIVELLIGVILEERRMRWQQLHVGVVKLGCTTRRRNLRSNFFLEGAQTSAKLGSVIHAARHVKPPTTASL